MNSSKGRSRKKKLIFSKKILLTLAAVFLLGTAATGSSLAFLVDQAGKLTNTFQPSEVTGEIEEKFDGYEKKDVLIKNTGDIPAYVRVALVPNWVDASNNIADEVEQEDYAIDLALKSSGWFEGSDGYYYYSHPVDPNASTPVLVNSCKPLVSKTDVAGNELHFELHVIASLIQAEPDEAVTKAWGVTVTPGANEGDPKTISKSTQSNE